MSNIRIIQKSVQNGKNDTLIDQEQKTHLEYAVALVQMLLYFRT